jgi:perosamine synthetase
MGRSVAWDSVKLLDQDIEMAVRSMRTHIGANGPNVAEFESALSTVVNAKHVICVNNGTSALVASCMAIRELYGDMVVGVPNFSFIATAAAPALIFSRIEFLDVCEKTWNLKPVSVSDDVQLIIPVDVGGVPCDFDDLKQLNRPMIADSAESIGSSYKGSPVGGQADLHCFSFHRSKVLTCGEGGAVSTNCDELAAIIRSVVSHGYDPSKRAWEYKHNRIGLNFRMTDVEAAIGLSQLKYLQRNIEHRREIAAFYTHSLSGKFPIQQFDHDKVKPNWFFYGILVESTLRERYIVELIGKGIQVKSWASLASQQSFKRVDPPISKALSESVLLLPINNSMTLEDAEYVVNQLLAL